MRWLRTILVAGCAIGLAGTAVPALAAGGKQLKGIIETVHASDHHVVIRETGGKKGQVPLAVAKDANIAGPAGGSSFAELHVGDEVTVHYRTGSHGEEATAIQVTKAAAAR